MFSCAFWNPRAIVTLAVFLIAALICGAPAVASVLPGGFESGGVARAVTGISSASNAGGCCWMERHAIFTVQQPAGTDRLRIAAFAPDYAGGPHLRETVHVVIDGVAHDLCCVRTGNTELVVPLKRAMSPRRFSVELTFPYVFEPKRLGIDADTRELSVLLRGIRLEDSVTGASTGALVPVVRPWLPRVLKTAVIFLGALGVLLLTLRRLAWGALALLASVPFLFALAIAGTTVTLPKAALIAFALGLAVKLHDRLLAGKAFVVLGTAFGLVLVSMMLSAVHDPAQHAALREILKTTEYLVTFALVYAALAVDGDEELFVRGLALVTVLVVLLAVLATVLGSTQALVWEHHVVPRLAGPLEGPNQFSGFLGVVLSVLLARMLAGQAWAIVKIAFAAGIVAAALTFSKGGAFGMLCAFAVVALIAVKPARARSAVATVIIAVIVLVAVAIGVGTGHIPHADRVFGRMSDLRGGLGTRTLLWTSAVQMWSSHPLFGVGPGRFELVLDATRGIRTHANNAYLNQLAEGGIVGFAAFFALTVSTLIAFVHRVRSWPVLAALGASVSLAIHQTVDTLWIYPKVGLTFAIVLAFGAATADRALRKDQQVVDLARDGGEIDALHGSTARAVDDLASTE